MTLCKLYISSADQDVEDLLWRCYTWETMPLKRHRGNCL